jgi:hypothetical protein
MPPLPALNPDDFAFVPDAPVFYNVGIWGQRGYGVPNWGENKVTTNTRIERLVREAGMRTSEIMSTPAEGRLDPPPAELMDKIVSFLDRARVVLLTRMVSENKPGFESPQVTSPRIPFRVFPCPTFEVQNPVLRDFVTMSHNALATLMQSADARDEWNIREATAVQVLKFLRRYEREIAIELYGIKPEVADEPTFSLRPHHDGGGYQPSKNGYFTPTKFNRGGTMAYPQQYELGALRTGVLVTNLPPDLGPYPYDPIDLQGLVAVTAPGAAPGLATAVASASNVPDYPPTVVP